MNGVPFHFNLAWNSSVYKYINLGVYNKFLEWDKSQIRISFFGSIPGLPLNGGRIPAKLGGVPLVDFIRHIHWLNDHEAGFVFVFNNTLAEAKHLEDATSNFLLKECESPLNHVVSANSLLKNYITDKFPAYRSHASCMVGYTGMKSIDQLCEEYDIVVLPEDLNVDLDYISKLRYKEKIEVILNSSCMYNCRLRDKHYRLIHDYILRENQNLPVQEFQHPCYAILPYKKDWIVDDGNKKADKQYIFPNNLHYYLERGIRRFKFLDRRALPELPLLLDYWNIVVNFIQSSRMELSATV